MKANLRIYYDKFFGFWCVRVDSSEGNYVFSCNSRFRIITCIKYFWWKNVTIRLQNRWSSKSIEKRLNCEVSDMTQNEKFECAIHCVKVMSDVELCKGCKAYKMEYSICQEIAMEALKAIEEVQEYRKLGTVEELKTAQRYINLAKKHGTIGKVIESCADYESIGTVEEVREAVEKTKPIKPDVVEVESGTKYLMCPKCKLTTVIYNEMVVGYCPKCGQKLKE